MDPILSTFDRQFVLLDRRSRDLLMKLPEEMLFEKPRVTPNSMAMFSCGEYLLRSAAMIEKTFGGITTRLWDDPFEWTLPEKLNSRDSILRYLDEVEETRKIGFRYFNSDADLTRELPAPEKLRTLIDILLEAVSLASHFQGRAFSLYQFMSNEKIPRL